MANDAIIKYKDDLKHDFEIVISRFSGEAVQKIERPLYTSEDLKGYADEVTSIIPTIKPSGDPAKIHQLTAAIKNASMVKAKINTKRLEAFCGDRVRKACTALSFYTKAVQNEQQSVISDSLYPVI